MYKCNGCDCTEATVDDIGWAQAPEGRVYCPGCRLYGIECRECGEYLCDNYEIVNIGDVSMCPTCLSFECGFDEICEMPIVGEKVEAQK
jgi:hypothetical protein